MVQLTLAPVLNENLFSVHYLEERLKNSDKWKEADGAEAAFEKIKEIYEDRSDIIRTYTNNEAQLEMDFIRPILKVLGHNFAVQATVQKKAKRPDYAFFDDDEDKRKAFKNKDSDDFYKNAIAVGDAKAWNKDLDKKLGGRDVFENQNPSYQIDYYLRVTAPEWGVLTNGRKWRLYFEGSPQPIGTYYEVDLIDILEKDDFENFKYFYLFFKRGAFTPVEGSFLDRVYNQSLKYSHEIGENLEENVYKALLWMSKGYFNMGTNNLEKNEENVEWVHENSLIFLYRLLFLFYTESKGILGTEVPQKYANEYSFAKWVDDILNDIDSDDVGEQGGLYNHRLFSIFELVREGSEAVGIPKEEFYIPAYNGGLFDSEKQPFLKNKKIQDGHIARVVDLLARVASKEHGSRSRVDYSDLAIRHLGGIYEGLLEYKPRLADQDIVAAKKKGTLKWIPVPKAKKDFSEFDEDKRVREGELYLATDKGERKATGSYYTPDYIVKYIVENTVGPVIEKKLENAETNEEKREAILETKVLDPAMGSGHFLVEATDFLANEFVKYIREGEKEERDIDWANRKVARNCIYGVDVNPLATELAKVSLWLNTMAEDKPLSFLDHHLKTGNSLIGADIHKLDKHPEDLEEGIKAKGKSGQLVLSDFFGKSVQDDIKELLDVYKKMLEISEERPEDIKEQEELFREFEAHLFKKKFDVLSDVQTGYYFGNEFSESQYERLLEAFRASSEDWEEITQEDWVKKASDSILEKIENNLSDTKRFFHWKLEFPEVFFDIEKGQEKVNPGFDVVLGNPPYFDIETKLSKYDKAFLGKNYEVYTGANDICYFFYERSFESVKSGGRFGMITSRYFREAKYGEKLRRFLSKYQINEIIDFGSNVKVFRSAGGEEVTIHTLIFLSEKSTPEGETSILELDDWPVEENNVKKLMEWIRDTRDLEEGIGSSHRLFSVSPEEISKAPWNFDPPIYRKIVGKMHDLSQTTLGKIDEKSGIYHVVKSIESGLDRTEKGGKKRGVFRLTEREVQEKNIEQDLLIPLVKTTHIDRYVIKPHKEFLLYVTPETNLDEYPNTKKHLNEYKELLGDRHDIKNSNLPWYSLSNLRNRELFEKKSEKILCPMVSPYNRFALKPKSDKLAWSADVYYGVPKEGSDIDVYFVLALCNSKLLEFFHQRIAKTTNWGYSYASTYVSQYPIFKEGNEKIENQTKDLYKKKVDQQKEVKSFLKWVSREWRTKIHDLSLHTKLEEYWKYDFDEMIRIAKKNKSEIDGDPSSRKFQEKLEKEWRASVDKLKPLVDEIQDLENQIDALVFKLYELDEEEVEVVLDSLDTEEEIKQDILKRFQEVKISD